MAHAFLEPDFLLRRATPTPVRTQAPATSRPAFSIPEPDRAQARPQDIRARTARAPAPFVQGAAAPNTLPRDTGAPSPRPRDGRTDEVRPERDHPDVPVRSERPSAPERTVRDGPTSTRSGTAPTDADASGKVASGKAASSKTGTEVTGAVRDSAAAAPAGATGSPEAAMAAAVNADAGTTLEAGSAEEPVTGGMEEDGEAGEISTEDPEASLLSSGFLPPPPPPTSPVRHGASDSTAEGEASGTSIPSSSGPGHPPAGALKPSQGDVPGVADEAGPGKADPAVAVRDAKATAAEIALPDGMPRVRESFDSLLPAASAAPAAAPTQTTSVSVTQPSPAAAPPVPLGAVPMTIGLRSLQGSNHFEIRLDPGELGRIDVSLDIDKERGTVMAHLVVDRVETLALLQRDTGSLQQALSQAGLDASEANINVSLRSDTQSGGRGADGQGADGRHPGGRPGGPGLPGQPEGRAALAPVPMRTLRGLTGLDIRI